MFKIGNFYYPDGGGAFWENLSIAIIGAFIGFSGALFIFWKSTNSTRNEEKRKNKIYLINRIEFLSLLLADVLKTSKLQIEKYIEQGKSINENPYEIHIVGVPATNQIARLQAIDSQNLYEGFRIVFSDSTKVTELYNNFFYQIDFLEKSLEEQLTANIKNIESLAVDQEKMRIAVNQLYSDFPKYFRDPAMNPMFSLQFEKFEFYIGTGRLDIRDFHENFLIPLFLKIREIVTEDLENQSNLLGSIRSVTTIIEHFKFNNKNYADTDALGIEGDLKECLKYLEIFNSDTIKKITKSKLTFE